MRRLLGGSVLFLILFGVLAPAASAGAAPASLPDDVRVARAGVDDFTFDSFDADFTLTRAADGSSRLAVVETIVARFPQSDQNHGIARDIPDVYAGVPLDTLVTSVTDELGHPRPYTVDLLGDFMEVVIVAGDYVHGKQTYVISYQQSNVVGAFADTGSDEFYWDINGDGWAQPFGRVTATVHVDAAIAPSLTHRVACYQGPRGSSQQCDSLDTSYPTGPQPSPTQTPTSAPSASPAAGEEGVIVAEARDLGPHETLTIAIGFAAGTFVVPTLPPVVDESLPIPPWLHAVSGALGLLSLGTLGGAIAFRVRAGRGAAGRGIIIPQYSEPTGITILEAAHLIDRGETAIPAAIVRLAVRHNLRILAYPTQTGGDPYTLQYLTNDRASTDDAELIATLFGANPQPGALRGYGSDQQDLMVALRSLSTNARESIVTRGLKRRAPGVGFGIATVAAQFVLGILAFFVLVFSFALFVNASGFVLLSMFVIFFAFLASVPLAFRPYRVTEAGAESRDFLLGMKEYLTLAEQDRLRMLQSPQGAERIDVGDNLEMIKLYERLLPWAVLWGVEDRWMSELAVRVAQLPEQPDWFVGSSGFEVGSFVSTMRGMSSSLVPPASTSSGWSSSGGGSSFSGGSFGGGFSGGGGGGGGGGGR